MKFCLQLLVVVCVLSLFACVPASAAPLFGQVKEVADGENISVQVEKLLLKVRLCALTAPKGTEPFAAISREHLAVLVEGKVVSVEYVGLDRVGSMLGVVTLNGADVGMQMIRDGAAAYNKKEMAVLPEKLRDFYEQSEAAARKEGRGIWQSAPASIVAEPKQLVPQLPDAGAHSTSAKAEAAQINDAAYVLIQQFNFKAALPKVREALRLDPDLAEAHKNLALVLSELGNQEEAILEGREAIRLNPNLDKAHYVMGKIMFAIGDDAGSVREYTEAIRLNPDYARAFYNLGITLTRMRLFDRALSAYDQAGRLQPQWAEVEINSGWVLHQIGKRAEARERWKKVLTMKDPVAALQAEQNLKATAAR